MFHIMCHGKTLLFNHSLDYTHYATRTSILTFSMSVCFFSFSLCCNISGSMLEDIYSLDVYLEHL